MATDVILPSMGFDMTEGKLVTWLKKEGEKVEKDQAIAEIETEKATVEIVATVSGVLAKIIVKAGQTVPVGTIIGVIAEPGETLAEIPETPSVDDPSSPVPAGKEKVEMIAAPSTARIKSTPVARRMADEAGIDLSRIKGSGLDGRVTERDVQAAFDASPLQTGPTAGGGTPAAASVPLNRMRHVHDIEPGYVRRRRIPRHHQPAGAAILAVGFVARRPVAIGGEVRIASLMKATLSVDHRVADGAQAGRFLQEFKKLLENPVKLLTE